MWREGDGVCVYIITDTGIFQKISVCNTWKYGKATGTAGTELRTYVQYAWSTLHTRDWVLSTSGICCTISASVVH